MPLTAPGIPILWAYIEELGLFSILNKMQLTVPIGKEHYSWLDLLLFDIGRRFMGISTLSGACESASPELAWFAHLYSPPCNDTILDGLANISEKQVVQIRKWLVGRLAQLGIGVDNNTLLVAEFRKSSARGTTTVKRFTTETPDLVRCWNIKTTWKHAIALMEKVRLKPFRKERSFQSSLKPYMP